MTKFQPSIGVKIYTHTDNQSTTVRVYADRTGKMTHSNLVNVYRLARGQSVDHAKLMMFNFSIRTAQQRFNLGDVEVQPGDQLYAHTIKPGLKFTVTKKSKAVSSPFDLFA